MNTGKDLEPYKEQESSETSKIYTEKIITMIIYYLFNTIFKLLKKNIFTKSQYIKNKIGNIF